MTTSPRRPRNAESPTAWAAWMLDEGLSYADAAALLGISKAAVHRRLRDAVDVERDRRADEGLEHLLDLNATRSGLGRSDGSQGYRARRLPQDQEPEG